MRGDYQMLETSQERVKLLKAGFDSKTMEKLYLIYNNFKITCIPKHFELVEINMAQLQHSCHQVPLDKLITHSPS